jgi:hypothetical protein
VSHDAPEQDRDVLHPARGRRHVHERRLGLVSFNFTSSSGGCPTTCSQAFQLTWKDRTREWRRGAPGVYDIGLTTTISGGQLDPAQRGHDHARVDEDDLPRARRRQGGISLAMSANVVDLDLGQATGTGIYSPDANLSGSDLVTFELFDARTRPASPARSARSSPRRWHVGSPTLLLPASGGTFKLRTTFVGNDFYTTSSDLDTITVTPSNTAPSSPFLQARDPRSNLARGRDRSFLRLGADAEDDPDPTRRARRPRQRLRGRRHDGHLLR